MKSNLILTLTLFLFTIGINAQTDSLTYNNGFWRNGAKLSRNAVKEIVIKDAGAYSKFKSARTLEIMGYIVGWPSAYVFGYDLGTRIGGGEGNNSVLLISGIGTAVGMVLSISAESGYKKSIAVFNKNHRKNQDVSTLDFGITPTGGVGLTLKF